MYKLKRAILFFPIAVLTILLPSCSSEEDKPSFDYLQTQLTADLFRQIKDGNAETALNKAEKLQDLKANSEALNFIAERIETRLFFRRLNDLTADGDIKTAQKILEKRQVPYSGRGNYNAFENTLENFHELHKYLADKPYKSGLKGYENLISLADDAQLLKTSELFRKWHEREKVNMLRRRKKEILDSIRQHIKEEGSPSADAVVRLDLEPVLEQLCTDLINPTFKNIRNYLKENRADNLKVLLLNNDYQETGGALEILASWYWPRLNSEIKSQLGKYLKDRQPVSDAGVRLKCLLAAGKYSIQDGVKHLRKYVEKQRDVDDKLLNTVIPEFVLPWRHLQAAPWLQTYPSFCDILDQITQLRIDRKKNDG